MSFLQFLCISCLIVFSVSDIAIATFKQLFGFSYTNLIALYITYILWPLFASPTTSSRILVFRSATYTIFGTPFYTRGQALPFAFSITRCDAIKVQTLH